MIKVRLFAQLYQRPVIESLASYSDSQTTPNIVSTICHTDIQRTTSDDSHSP